MTRCSGAAEGDLVGNAVFGRGCESECAGVLEAAEREFGAGVGEMYW